jgi:hypothetical protein
MPVRGPVSSSSWIPAACRVAERVISSAALRASRFISATVRMTAWSGAADRIDEASRLRQLGWEPDRSFAPLWNAEQAATSRPGNTQ